MSKKSWADQSSAMKILVVVLAAVEFGLLGAAQWDISRRDPSELRGSKGKWRAVALLNLFGPIWYFARGRK